MNQIDNGTEAQECSVDSCARALWDGLWNGLSERAMWRCCGWGVYWVREDHVLSLIWAAAGPYMQNDSGGEL